MKKNESLGEAYGSLATMVYSYHTRDAHSCEINFYESFIQQHPGRILEPMSGSGRLQIPLMQKGYVVDGIDTSPHMIALCRARCAELNLNPLIIEAPLQTFTLTYRYALAMIPIGSFQHIIKRSDALRALKNIYAHLLQGAVVLLDIFFPPDMSILPTTHIQEFVLDEQRKVVLTSTYQQDTHNKYMQLFDSYELFINNHSVQKEDEVFQITWYSLDEIQELLLRAGFSRPFVMHTQFCDTQEVSTIIGAYV